MPYQTTTRATLRQRLIERYESSPFWTTAQSNAALNEALRVWNMLTGHWKERIVITTPTSVTPWITLPSSIVYGMRLTWNEAPLRDATLFEMDQGRPEWEGETTASGGAVPTQPEKWMPAGLTLLAIWPADNDGNNSLVVDGVARTPVLSTDADFVDLGQSEEQAIIGYALHTLTFKEGGGRWKATTSMYQEFLASAAQVNERLRASSFFRKAMGLDEGRVQQPFRKA